MSRVEDLFVNHRAQIGKLREADSNFKEICSDYEQLANLLESGVADNLAQPMRESLEGLEHEIKDYLAETLFGVREQGST